MRTLIAGSGIIAGLIIQALFLYAVPFALLSDKKFAAAVGESMRMVWRSPAESFLLVLFPFILTLPMMFLSFKAEMIALRLSPDIMIHIYLASEVMKIISSFLITAGATILFIRGSGDPAD